MTGFVPVVEHFERERHLSPSPSNWSRLSQLEAGVCKAVDPIDGQSVEDLARMIGIYTKEVIVAVYASKPCYDTDFIEWVMRSDKYDSSFLALCSPSRADLRALLKRRQLSLIPTQDMFKRLVRILGETCRQPSALGNRDSGAALEITSA